MSELVSDKVTQLSCFWQLKTPSWIFKTFRLWAILTTMIALLWDLKCLWVIWGYQVPERVNEVKVCGPFWKVIFRKQKGNRSKLQICVNPDDQWAGAVCFPAILTWQSAVGQEPRRRHLGLSASGAASLVKSPAKAAPHWSHHSLSSPGRLEGTLQCWSVALNSPKKGVGVRILGNTTRWKRDKATGLKRAPVEGKMSSTKEPTALFACSKCFTRHPFEELSQGQQLCKVSPRKFRKSNLFFIWAILAGLENMLILFTNPVASH